jgi:hypothetical protein
MAAASGMAAWRMAPALENQRQQNKAKALARKITGGIGGVIEAAKMKYQ